jgi:hypothetical protein
VAQVRLAREFESADEDGEGEETMGGAAGGAQLQRFFTMVMSGLAGASTTMVSVKDPIDTAALLHHGDERAGGRLHHHGEC